MENAGTLGDVNGVVVLLHKQCKRLVGVEMHAGTIADPHIIRAHGECEEIKLVDDPDDLAAHGINTED